MRLFHSTTKVRLLLGLSVLIAVSLAGAFSLVSVPATAGNQGTGYADVKIESVCDAQKLKRDLAENGQDSSSVTIPKEFDKPWPSLKACEAHDAAEDEDAPGPLQPIAFSHRHHAKDYSIDCLYCHSNTDRSQAAGVPSVEVCMGCHGGEGAQSKFPAEFNELEGIRVLKEHWDAKKPIEWIQVHRLPEHVQFRHNRHVAAKLACQTCHGPVEEMDKVYLVPDTRFVNGMPSKKLEMGWCVDCHRENQAPTNCLTCHY